MHAHIRRRKKKQSHRMHSHRAAVEGQLEKSRRWIRRGADLRHGQIIQAKVVRPGQDVRIGRYPADELAHDDAEREDVRALIVPLALQALGGHPVGAADRAEPITCTRVRDLGRQAEVTDHGGELAVAAGVFLPDQDVLGREVAMEDATAVQVAHAAGRVAGELHARQVGQGRVTGLYQLLEAAAVDVLGEGVKLALVHADTHEPAG